jgi:hypothetical protein
MAVTTAAAAAGPPAMHHAAEVSLFLSTRDAAEIIDSVILTCNTSSVG